MTFYLKGHCLNGYLIEEKRKTREVFYLGKNGERFGFNQFGLQFKKVGMSRKDNNLTPILPERIVCKGRSIFDISLITVDYLPSQIPTLGHISHRKDEPLDVLIFTYLIYIENINSHLKNFLSNPHYGSSNHNNEYQLKLIY